MTINWDALNTSIETRRFLLCGFVNCTGSLTISSRKKVRRQSARRAAGEHATIADYTSISDLLYDLDRLFAGLKKLNIDRQDSALMNATGIFVDAGRSKDWAVCISSLEFSGLPAFCSVAMPSLRAHLDEDERNTTWVWVAQKLNKNNSMLETKKRDEFVYEMRAYAPSCGNSKIDSSLNKRGLITNFFVAVGSDKKFRQLRHRTDLTVKSKRGFLAEWFSLHRWSYQPVFDDGSVSVSPKKAVELAIAILNIAAHREMNTNIVAVDPSSGRRLIFSVPMHGWKRFFSDRIDVVTSSGKRRPIFHWVMPHRRKTSCGSTIVKTHMRGSRDFTWNGYDIKIVLPKKHGVMLSEFDVAAEYENEIGPEKPDLVPIENFAPVLSQHLFGEKLSAQALAG